MCNCHRGVGRRCPSDIPVRGLIHLAILKVVKDRPTYGSEIQRTLRERFSIEVPRAMVYGLLQRLEGNGFLTSTWDTRGNGPARRIYRITEEGEEYLKEALDRLARVKEIIDELTSG